MDATRSGLEVSSRTIEDRSVLDSYQASALSMDKLASQVEDLRAEMVRKGTASEREVRALDGLTQALRDNSRAYEDAVKNRRQPADIRERESFRSRMEGMAPGGKLNQKDVLRFVSDSWTRAFGDIESRTTDAMEKMFRSASDLPEPFQEVFYTLKLIDFAMEKENLTLKEQVELGREREEQLDKLDKLMKKRAGEVTAEQAEDMAEFIETGKGANEAIKRRGGGGGGGAGEKMKAAAGTMTSLLPLLGLAGGPAGAVAGGALSLLVGKITLEKVIDIATSVMNLVDEQILLARKMRTTFAMPGVSTGGISTTDMWAMAKQIDSAMRQLSNGLFTLEDFQNVMVDLKQSGMAMTMPLIGSRSFVQLARDMGEAGSAISASKEQEAKDTEKARRQAQEQHRRNVEAAKMGEGPYTDVAPAPPYMPSEEESRATQGVAAAAEAARKPMVDQLTKAEAELTAFAFNVTSLSMATGMTTKELIQNANQLNRTNIGFGSLDTTLSRIVNMQGETGNTLMSTMGGVAESAVLGSVALNELQLPADEFISDMVSASQVVRFFSSDINKSKKELIGLAVKEKEALQGLIFSITDVTNLMDKALRPDLTQSALMVEMVKRNPEKYGKLAPALAGAGTEGALAAAPLLAQFNKAEFDRYMRETRQAKAAGREAPLIPATYQALAEAFNTNLEGLAELVPDIDRALTQLPADLTEATGLKGGAKALFVSQALPSIIPWFQMSSSKDRMTTDAMMNFANRLEALGDVGLTAFSRNVTDVNTQLSKLDLTSTSKEMFEKISAGVVSMLAKGITGDIDMNMTGEVKNLAINLQQKVLDKALPTK